MDGSISREVGALRPRMASVIRKSFQQIMQKLQKWFEYINGAIVCLVMCAHFGGGQVELSLWNCSKPEIHCESLHKRTFWPY